MHQPHLSQLSQAETSSSDTWDRARRARYIISELGPLFGKHGSPSNILATNATVCTRFSNTPQPSSGVAGSTYSTGMVDI